MFHFPCLPLQPQKRRGRLPDGVLIAASVDGVLRAASVGRTLSPSASVVVLLMSDFLAYYY
jgi:hypothetical protein